MRLAPRLPRLPLFVGAAGLLGAAIVALTPGASAPTAPPPVPLAAPPLPAPLSSVVPVAPAAPAPAVPAGLQLVGVLGYRGGAGAAIFGFADGRQLLVPLGHQLAPGVTLAAIDGDRATLRYGGQQLDLALPDAAGAPAAPAPPSTPLAAADPRRDLANFRLGLKAEGEAARPRGYRIRGGVPLPFLDQAGLREGDLVLAVNGQPLDQERLLELPSELAAASKVEIDFERDGRRLQAVVPTH